MLRTSMKSVDLLIKMIRFQVQQIIEQFVRTLEMLLMVRNAVVTIPLPSNSTLVCHLGCGLMGLVLLQCRGLLELVLVL